MASVESDQAKVDSSKRTRRRVLVTATVCVLLVGCVLAVVLIVVSADGLSSTERQRAFDRSEWVSAEVGARCPMRDDSARQVAVGMTRAQVTDLLGDPDYAGQDYAEYYLGGCNGLTIDVYSLRVEFKAHQVERAFISIGD